jgi:oxygen-dependent protoporphyrinogen oxidase
MQRFDCVVVGGGLAGLLAAYEASNAGKSVVLYEATKHYGGAIASIDIMGIKVDAGAESFATTRPEALSLIKELGLSDLLVTPERSDARIFNQGQSFLIPHGMMGIPSDLTDPNTIALLGDEEAAYAAELDSLPWNITDERTGWAHWLSRKLLTRWLRACTRRTHICLKWSQFCLVCCC